MNARFARYKAGVISRNECVLLFLDGLEQQDSQSTIKTPEEDIHWIFMNGRKQRTRTVEKEIKILLADQDRIFLELGKVYLRKTGTRVLYCDSGKEALEIIREHRPDLVFMSSLLHDISGLECCSTVKADPTLRGTPVALTLTAGNPENVETCNHAGCNEIVLKPIDRHTFFQIVTKYVDLEKRNAPRFKGKLTVHCSLPDGSSVASETYDISLGGLFLESNRPLPASTVISLQFELPTPRTEITCSARVAWINTPGFPTKPAIPSGMGVQLLELRPEWTDAILEFIHKEYIVRMI